MPISNIQRDEQEKYTVITGHGDSNLSFRVFVLDKRRPDDGLRIEFDGFNGGAYTVSDAVGALQAIAKGIAMIMAEGRVKPKQKGQKECQDRTLLPSILMGLVLTINTQTSGMKCPALSGHSKNS